MPYLLNLLYLSFLFLLSPWLLYKVCTTAKWRRNLWAKFLGRAPRREAGRPCVWFHGVSVGEVHLLRQVVARFRQARPDCEVVLSASTVTGLEEARKHFAEVPVFCWPLDFSWAVRRVLNTIRPDLVVLAESELWPNFLLAAKRQGVKVGAKLSRPCSGQQDTANHGRESMAHSGVNVAVINGRMSPRSFNRYRKVAFLVGWLLRRVDLWCMQNDEYAAGMRGLGVPAARVVVTGSVKYDGVNVHRDNPRTQEFRRLFTVEPGDLVWVAGSTQTPEEDIVLDIFQKLKSQSPELRLILVPRQKDRFDEAAELLRRRGIPFVRRSQLTQPVEDCRAVILLDTLGELGAVWGLADIAFVGGSLDGQRGGQNMIEPAAYGAAVVFGPHTWNFKDTVTRLLQCRGAIQVSSAQELAQQVTQLACDPLCRRELGDAAQRFVQSQQGATEQTIARLLTLLGTDCDKKEAA